MRSFFLARSQGNRQNVHLLCSILSSILVIVQGTGISHDIELSLPEKVIIHREYMILLAHF